MVHSAYKENPFIYRKRKDRTVRAAEIVKFVDAISTQEPEPDDFSEELWIAAIDHVTAYTDGTLGFTFRNSEEVGCEGIL